MADTSTPITVQAVEHPLLIQKDVRLTVLRTDLVHPEVSGNKWFKLKYNLEAARLGGYKTLLSFGGAFSNHLHALAYAGHLLGLSTVGVVRGELGSPLNPTLREATQWGMHLLPLSRAEYKRRYDPHFVAQIAQQFDACYVVPEGGANALAVRGCQEIAWAALLYQPLDYLCVPCGTGATLAGLVSGLGNASTQVLGFSALKGALDVEQRIQALLAADSAPNYVTWQVRHDMHCGGFAKLSDELVTFMEAWLEFSEIPLDPIYTNKMFWGIFNLMRADYFPEGAHIMAVHTGGLQGWRGMAPLYEKYRLRLLAKANHPR